MEHPDVFLGFLIFLISGIFAGLIVGLPILSAAVFLCSFFFIVFKKDAVFFLFLAVFLVGAIRSNQAVNFLKNNKFLLLGSEKEEIFLTGIIDSPPEEKTLHQTMVVRVEKIFDKKQSGKILVYADNDQKFIPKEKIFLKGKLIFPQNFGDFDYKNHLAKTGISFVVFYPEIKKEKEAPAFWRFIFKTKQKLRLVLDEALIFPKNILLRAIVLGDKKELPDYLKESFNKSGIRHITAISGMHIAIFINIFMALLLSLGIKRKICGIIVFLFITFYLFLIGFPPSAIRAAIMGLGVVLAQIVSRMPNPIRFLLFSAAAMLLISPFLIFDIGFQLSFLATVGIIYSPLFFGKKFKKLPEVFGLKSSFLMTLSAQLFTLPIVFYHFGRFSLLSPLANVLTVPLMPFIFGVGVLGAIMGLFFPLLGFLVLLPVSFLLGYVIFVSDSVCAFSFFEIQAKIPPFLVFAYYALMAFFLYRQKKEKELFFLEY